jgi:hypothetical protein
MANMAAVAQSVDWLSACLRPQLGVDRKWSTDCQTGALGPIPDFGPIAEQVAVLDKAYFATRCLVGVIAVGSVGEMAKVSQVVQPWARLAVSNSP